ncbi:hypothetical protein [Variovorax sp. YR216]|uniref:hypothetical protein n=1 Tax=Variovorax sp. YR216 TaxID=1882828 RepID=UPI0008957DEF|nr:hypothetical protein [Variovorax sp. YR216]SEB19212.1 hypothetical protein SAMN05444680_112139 [Variovorax sp. YR216]
MNTYPTSTQATNVARILSKSLRNTIVVYRAAENKFITARPRDTVKGLVVGAFRNGYEVPVGELLS